MLNFEIDINKIKSIQKVETNINILLYTIIEKTSFSEGKFQILGIDRISCMTTVPSNSGIDMPCRYFLD